MLVFSGLFDELNYVCRKMNMVMYDYLKRNPSHQLVEKTKRWLRDIRRLNDFGHIDEGGYMVLLALLPETQLLEDVEQDEERLMSITYEAMREIGMMGLFDGEEYQNFWNNYDSARLSRRRSSSVSSD